MLINKQSIRKALDEESQFDICFCDLQKFGQESSCFDRFSSPQTIWFLRCKLDQAMSLSQFWMEAFWLTEDYDFDRGIFNGDYITEISHETVLEFAKLCNVDSQLELNEKEEMQVCYSMSNRWIDKISIGKGSEGYFFFRWSTTA